MPTNACSKPSTNNYAADLGAGPAIHKTGKQTSSQRELCQKFVSAPPRKALAVVSSRAPLPSSPIAPADYHFRYLLLIGEKERLGSTGTAGAAVPTQASLSRLTDPYNSHSPTTGAWVAVAIMQ